MTIRNPIEWTGAQFVAGAHALGAAAHSFQHVEETIHSPAPGVYRIGYADVRDALRRGFEDFEAYRSDVVFLCVTYAVVGLIMARLAFGMDVLPLLFPLASGFAILGPVAALGLYEMSRRREQGAEVNWANAFDVLKAPAIGAIVLLGALLVAIFLLWLAAAWTIYAMTLGPAMPQSVGSFLHDVFLTAPGQLMIVAGVGTGFVFALLAMTISLVSFPLLLDRDVGLDTAVRTSARAVMTNPGPMAAWGLIVAGALVLGSIPLFLGLIVAIPVLGHATWHLYRKLVVR
ncbi:MAG TPA: DUF2189 domain-containing protein [Rhizomicrobium sp.]|jgi:uncharacterized membrane protein|nr:DUF2189 domain-containing protein [Rhizomicrobium sp.]